MVPKYFRQKNKQFQNISFSSLIRIAIFYYTAFFTIGFFAEN